MKYEFLPTVQCLYCEKYYIIKCAHADGASEGDYAHIAFSSREYIEIEAIKDES